VASRFHGNDSWLSAVDHWWPPLLGGATLRDVTRCHDNGNPFPLLPLVDGQSPMLSGGGRWLLQPPTVFSQPPRCPSAPVPSVSPFQELATQQNFLSSSSSSSSFYLPNNTTVCTFTSIRFYKSRTARPDKNTNSCPKTCNKTVTGYIFYHTSKILQTKKTTEIHLFSAIVGFVAAAVSMSAGGCRAVRTDDVSLVPAVIVDVPIAVGPAVL